MFIGITKVRRKVWTIRGSNINRRAASAPPLPFLPPPHPWLDWHCVNVSQFEEVYFSSCHGYSSMTQLLSHTIAHFTGPSFMLKANNQPYKKNFGLAFSWAKVVKNCKILTFKVNFRCQKLSEAFQKKISSNNINLGAHFLLLTFLTTSIFKALYFLKWRPFFDRIYTSVRKT